MGKQKLKNSLWIRVPLELFNKKEYDLNPTEIIIASVYYDNGEVVSEKEIETSISQYDIAEKLNISRRTVIRATEKLIYNGVLIPKDQSKGETAVYKLNTNILPPKQYQIRQIEKHIEKMKGV